MGLLANTLTMYKTPLDYLHSPITSLVFFRSQEFAENTTYSTLVAVTLDLGKLQALSLRWEGEPTITSWWRQVTNIMSGAGHRQDKELSVAQIRLKSGESQQK